MFAYICVMKYRLTTNAGGKRSSKTFDSEQNARKAYSKAAKEVEKESEGFARLEVMNGDQWEVLNEVEFQED